MKRADQKYDIDLAKTSIGRIQRIPPDSTEEFDFETYLWIIKMTALNEYAV